MSNQQAEECYEKIEEALAAIERVEVTFLRKRYEKKEEFLLSVQEWIEDKGFVTVKQAEAVDNICHELERTNVL